jgi:carbon-monoxide dehydrogenase large subunit
MPDGAIGAPIRRREDQRFLTGAGQYVDDINRPGQTYAWILRSSVAHAIIKNVDTSKAEAAPGVVKILTGAALTNAVLGTQGIHDIDMPARPNRVWQALQQSNG